jgi:hypothetical protein
MLFPSPPQVIDPRDWPEMELLAATVLLEAEGEGPDGRLAVAWVVRHRMDRRHLGIAEVVTQPWQFSCWNDDYVGMRKARLRAPDPDMWEDCWRAACGAYWRILDDPTGGADHYLNEALTRSQRGGSLPGWYDARRVTARIAQHTFLKLYS